VQLGHLLSIDASDVIVCHCESPKTSSYTALSLTRRANESESVRIAAKLIDTRQRRAQALDLFGSDQPPHSQDRALNLEAVQ
jgi:hypothetical protein